MTWPAFKEQMARLDGLKFAPATLDTHWEALGDLSPDVLEAAVGKAMRECDEYPSPKMLRSFASQMAQRVGADEDRSVPLAEPVVVPFPLAGRDLTLTRAWKFYCDRCEDTGWASFTCGVNGVVTCGRDMEHYQHEYANHCACWLSNPALLRKRERQSQQAHTRAAKSRGEA